ncbi:MAG: hypothetical protein EBR82_49570 [Caulobacteraceae bacterium]|nr:hypothetical protein [Caulobacteraceae bacterium]
MSYTTTEFITNVKKRSGMPTSQATFSVQNMLAFADAELRSFVVPLVMKAQEFYYAFDVDTALNSTGVYEIPSRAIGGKLVNVALVDGDTRRDVNWITEDHLTRYDQTDLGKPGVYLKRNQLYLVPADGNNSSKLRLTIIIRPGQLVETTECAQITGIDKTTGTLTFDVGSIPSTFIPGKKLDFIQAEPHFDHVEIDKIPTQITSTTLVFDSLSDRLQVGDWASLANQSCVIQCPVELHGMLEQATANTILRAQGDLEKLKSGEEKLQQIYQTTINTYNPRIEAEGKKITNRSRILRRF